MYSRSNGFPARTLVAVLALVWGVAVVSAASGGAPPTQTNAASAARSAPAVDKPASLQTTDFVGDETCATCHESEGKSLQGTLHGKAQNPRTPAATGHSCETCHGNGKAHVEDSGNKEKIKRFNVMSARESSATCLTCHNRGNHAQWQSSMHNARDLSCTTCHSVHSPKSDHAQLKTKSVIETCASCHKQEATKLLKSGHMPVREGKMDCTSCHNPHGSTNVRMLKTGNWITAKLRDLPRPAWVKQRPHARGQGPDALPAVPHQHAASTHGLRRLAAHGQEQPAGRAELRELPFANPRVE